jgi:hypothetical protein
MAGLLRLSAVITAFLVLCLAMVYAGEVKVAKTDSTQAGPDDAAVQKAIDLALDWLAKNQEADGRWDGEKNAGEDVDAGITGLAVLALLGGGSTETEGKYKDNVAKAIDWIIKQQDARGCIKTGYTFGKTGYNHAIAALALCETYGKSKVKRTGEAAQKAVDYSVKVHQKPGSGWRYEPGQDPDTSITGWFVMHLKAAKDAKLKVPDSAFTGAMAWLDSVTDIEKQPGRVGYASKSNGGRAMAASAMYARMLMGIKPKTPLIQLGAKYLVEELPAWNRLSAAEQGPDKTGLNYYYWFFGTRALAMVGGDYWKAWLPALRKTLIENQRREGDGGVGGTWDTLGLWANSGGIVFTTAMGALCLETSPPEPTKGK